MPTDATAISLCFIARMRMPNCDLTSRTCSARAARNEERQHDVVELTASRAAARRSAASVSSQMPRSPPVTGTHSCRIFKTTQPNAIVTMAR